MSETKEARSARVKNDQAEVKRVLEEAHASASRAFYEFKKTAKIAKEGYIVDACGQARVVVYKPSYRLRTTLQALGETSKSHDGAWEVSNFTKNVNEQSITAREVACIAACEVLKRRFPGEGEFFMKSRVD